MHTLHAKRLLPGHSSQPGEFKCNGYEEIDTERIARDVVKSIGYDRPSEHFS